MQEEAKEQLKPIPVKRKRTKTKRLEQNIYLEPPEAGIQFRVLLPLEVHLIKPLMIALFGSIGFTKARDNPDPYMARAIQESADAFTQLLIAEYNHIPVGYIWYRASRDMYGDNFVKVEQIYILDQFKNHISIVKRFMLQLIEFAKRVNMKYMVAEVSTQKGFELWAPYGFKSEYLNLKFMGSADELIKQSRMSRLLNGGTNDAVNEQSVPIEQA